MTCDAQVEFMRTRGNAWCSKVWLARWDPVNQPVDFKDDEKVKDFMVAKVGLSSLLVDVMVLSYSYVCIPSFVSKRNYIQKCFYIADSIQFLYNFSFFFFF